MRISTARSGSSNGWRPSSISERTRSTATGIRAAYGLLIDADPGILEAGLPSTVTATVFDPPFGRPGGGARGALHRSGGAIVADPPPDPPGQLSLQTDEEGKASILVTRNSPGTATVAAEINQPAGGHDVGLDGHQVLRCSSGLDDVHA